MQTVAVLEHLRTHQRVRGPFLVLAPHLFQSAVHMGGTLRLTDVAREPPFVRQFNAPARDKL